MICNWCSDEIDPEATGPAREFVAPEGPSWHYGCRLDYHVERKA